MKKILYISNIEVPYRNVFFNELSKKTKLEVLYERKLSNNRDSKWTSSINSAYEKKYLKGIKFGNEFCFSLEILRYIFSKKYSKIIIGCYNSPTQMLAILVMKFFKKKYYVNLDGEYFLSGSNLKSKIKIFFIKGATGYYIAGDKAKEKLERYIDGRKIKVYYFSSLTKKELNINKKHMNSNINKSVLVVGQYYDYKGLDFALKCAKSNNKLNFKFIGSGKRADLLREKIKEMNIKNVEVISFLSKEELCKEYQESLCLFLPSKRECWGLVINEAASYGCPIISSREAGAGVEFLSTKYDKYLVEYDNVDSFNIAIKDLLENELDDYKNYLIDKSEKYNIESNVTTFL